MLKCDVLVVGAGASGATASFLLSKAGFNVITIDKVSRIGEFTNPKIDITESELADGSKIDPILKELRIRPLKIFSESVWHSRNENFTLKSNIYDFYFKRGPTKDSLDFQIMKKAINKGCNFLFNTEVIKFNFKNENIEEVLVKNKRKKVVIKPKIIVGADGSFSKCRELAGINEKSYYLEGFGIRLKGKFFQKTNVILDSEFAPGGYIYAGSANNESVVGIVIDNKVTKKTSRDFFMLNKKRNDFFKKFKNSDILNFFGSKEKCGIVERLVKGNLVLTGMAGLLVDPFLGYGLNYAIFSGYKASKFIINGNLNDYENYYRKKFIPYFKNAIKARNAFRKLNNKDLDFVIKSLKFINEKKSNSFKTIIKIIKAKPSSISALYSFYTLLKALS